MRYLTHIFAALAGLLLTSCVSTQVLSTHSSAIDLDKPGEFNLILYGMDTPYDLESVAILDKAGDAYQFEATNRLHVKKILKNLTLSEASRAATEFLQSSVVLNRIDNRNIIGPQNKLVGYEFRPVFNEFQVSNSFYHSWYYLDTPEKIKFKVEWQQFGDPFSRN